MRREAQVIVPGLLLGAYNTATNADRLVEAGITHLYVASIQYDDTGRYILNLQTMRTGCQGGISGPP